MSRPTVLIADDHTLVAEGLQRIVEREFQCLGIVSHGAAVLRTAEHLSPDLVLLDLSLPDISGLEVARRLRRDLSQIKIFIISMMNTPDDVRHALAAGASGYLSKECAGTQLLFGIREIMRGGTYVSVGSFPGIRAEPPGVLRPSYAESQPITPRQRDVLELVVRGLPAKTIAHELSISPKTVEFHKTTMLRTLALRNTAELIRFAVENKLIDLSTADDQQTRVAFSAGANAA